MARNIKMSINLNTMCDKYNYGLKRICIQRKIIERVVNPLTSTLYST